MYTLKILVIGPPDSGTTQFITSLCEFQAFPRHSSWTIDVHPTMKSPTPIMEFGRILVDDDLLLYLFSWSLQHHFESVKDFLPEDPIGFVVIMDSTKPTAFREVKAILEVIRAYNDTPYVVAANKQDLADAWPIEDLRVALRLSDSTKLVPCIAHDKQSVINVLLELTADMLYE